MCEGNAGMHLRKAIIGMCVDSRDTECLNECMYVQCCGDGLLYATIRSVKAKSGVWGCWRSVCAPFTSQGKAGHACRHFCMLTNGKITARFSN